MSREFDETGRPESMEEREKIAEQGLRWKVVLKVWLIAGTIFFLLTGGFPWASSGLMDAIMGRRTTFPFWETLIYHYALAFIDTVVLCFVVYRFKPLGAILLGVFTGITILYGLNFLIFRTILHFDPATEPDTFLTHLGFSAITCATYKGMSIPRVMSSGLKAEKEEHHPPSPGSEGGKFKHA